MYQDCGCKTGWPVAGSYLRACFVAIKWLAHPHIKWLWRDLSNMSPESLSPQLVLLACLLFNFLWTPKSMIRRMTLTITVPAYSSSVNAVFQRLETDPLMVLRPSFFSHSHFFSWLFSSLPPDILSQESPNRTCRINYILLRSEESSEFGEHQELHHKSPRQRHWSH